jgi:translocation and assembly module TamB
MRAPVILLAGALAAAPLAAQDSDDSSGGLLVGFLEDTLSGENRNIRVTGLEGALSSRATIERLTVSDDEGVWFILEGAVLDWNRLALISGNFSVNALSADLIRVERAPNPAPPDPSLPAPEAAPFQLPELPVSIEIGEISAERIELGADLAGKAAALSLDGALTLADGTLDSRLEAARLDQPGDLLQMQAGFSNETSVITLDMQLSEGKDGLLAAALDLPGRPTVQFSAQGTGPVSDFTADIRLATNEAERLAGKVVLAAQPQVGSESPAPIRFSADLGGDISPLMEPDFRPFFGPGMRLTARGQNGPEGRLLLDSLALRTQALSVTGALALAPGGALETANLRAAITPPDGLAAVVLPVPGADTTLAALDIIARKSEGPGWDVQGKAAGLSTPDLSLALAEFTAAGTLEQAPELELDGSVTARIAGLELNDPALAQASGKEMRLSASIANTGQGAFRISDLLLQGTDYSASGTVQFEGLESGMKISGDLAAEAGDLSRFSGLAGQDIGGAARISAAGFAAPLNGTFDASLALAADDLTSGIDQLDKLIAGSTVLDLKAARGMDGIRIDRFALDGSALYARASGRLDSSTGALSFEAGLADLAIAVPGNPGPLTVKGDVTRADRKLMGQVRLDGPNTSFAALDGEADLDGNADFAFEAELAQLQRFVPELAGKLAASGRAARRGGLWQVEAEAKGPAGIEAAVDGSWDEAQASADMRARGRLRLDGANFFISPNSVNGAAEFDLALKGKPALESLSGTITTSGTSVAVPSALLRIEDIGGTVALQNGRADIRVSAKPSEGGRVDISGPVTLAAPFDGQVQTVLNGVVLTDKLAYETVLDGALTYSGPLAGDGQLTGRIDVGETNINVAAAGGSVTAAPIPPIRHVNEPAAQRATRDRAGLTERGNGGRGPVIGLDVLISAPNRIFARGRGLNAELGGEIQLRGSSRQLAPSGQISLIRGTFDILGRRLDLSDGQITLQGNLKPYLEFRSTTSTAEGTATLEVTGRIDAPEIKVTSDPSRPSEEALALLLFGDNVQDLSPLALARLAGSVATLSGRGGRTEGKLRDGTGADRVDIGADNGGAGLLGIGGYISDNVYTDFNINTRGDSELNINLDVSDNVTVKGTVDGQGETGLGVFFTRDY